ncbi:MAG: UDP-N-acetylmuramate--L-alanine ligase [Deltaproteobacteria bacterium]|nr:UDP-N-acetylmuramate--L-alanine ligase [Deltaproteobacteria bacterium]
MTRHKHYRLHFVGIGGIGMSGIAEILLNLGYRVSGSDLKQNDNTARLQKQGARVVIGPHAAGNLGEEADVVVVSSAVRTGNPEVLEARRRGIPVIPRAEMLAELMRLREGIAVGGSHGKTTTTSLIATICAHAGLDPTVVIGGKLNALGSNARLGGGDWIVVESDESDGSFLRLSPRIAVVTNIDPEHLDHYGDFEHLRAAFLQFANGVPFYGLSVLCLDHPVVQGLLPELGKRFATYGLASQADYRALGVRHEHDGWGSAFRLVVRGEDRGEYIVRMPGMHNVLNALAALAVADEVGIAPDKAREALASFGGIQRRFTVVGSAGGVTVIDDYGHHPAEIVATLEAAWGCQPGRIVAVFQPHRYSRVARLADEFTRAFNRADHLIVTEIYAAGEEPLPGVAASKLANAIRLHGHRDAQFIPDLAAVVAHLQEFVRPGDMVITLGAGDVSWAGRELLQLRGKQHGLDRRTPYSTETTRAPDGAERRKPARRRKT